MAKRPRRAQQTPEDAPVQPISEADLIAEITKHAPNFKKIPVSHQWTMALRAAGNTTEAVAAITGEGEVDVDSLWERYGDMVEGITPMVKVLIFQIMAINALNPMASTLYTDTKATEKRAAMDTVIKIGEAVITAKRLEKVMKDTQEDTELTMEEFGKTLGEEEG